MLKDVLPGKYIAKAVEGVFALIGEKGTRGVGVKFEFMNGTSKESIWHIMYLTDTGLKDGSTVLQKTFETLSKLGFDESKDLLKKQDGTVYFDKTFLADKEVEIVIELEPDQKDPTKTYHKVRWVNELGGSRLAGLPVQQVLGNISVKAEMAAARARLGAPKPAQNQEVPF